MKQTEAVFRVSLALECKSFNLEKKNLEECREEILKLTAQLDDKKREVHILETQVELLRTEKSRYESEWV